MRFRCLQCFSGYKYSMQLTFSLVNFWSLVSLTATYTYIFRAYFEIISLKCGQTLFNSLRDRTFKSKKNVLWVSVVPATVPFFRTLLTTGLDCNCYSEIHDYENSEVTELPLAYLILEFSLYYQDASMALTDRKRFSGCSRCRQISPYVRRWSAVSQPTTAV